jgi:GT2 family glycosyltransferase
MVSKKIYIVLLNYNGYKDTIACLKSVLKSDYKNYKIVVVDNASTDDSINYLLSWVKSEKLEYLFFTQKEYLHPTATNENSIIFILSDKNGGFASGNNLCIRYALLKDDFDYIWLLNNDTVIRNDTLSLLVEYAKTYKTGITGSALFYYHEPSKIQTYGGYIDKVLGTGKHITDASAISKLEYIVGASFLIDKKVIDKIGVLSEEYFLYYEDTDYSFEARKNGFKLGVAVDSIVYHKEGGSTGSNKNIMQKSDFSDFHSFKSRKIFLKKHLPNSYKLIFFQLIIYIVHRALHGKFKNVIALLKAFVSK